jgi:hypothetical protein
LGLRDRIRGSLAIVVAAAAVALLAGASPAQAARATCPDTFQVLHNDHIGKLELPAGHYTITVRNDNVLGCPKAADLFRMFLEDYDGNLRGRWHVFPNRRLQFRRGNTDVGFGVKRGSKSGHGGGKHPTQGARRCPGTFEVLHDDHIGKLKLPQGNYKITRLTHNKPTCPKAFTLFRRFLQDPSGNLPDHWNLTAYNATFTRRHTGNGFRVKQAS